jgi:thymidylate synthase (FAD)
MKLDVKLVAVTQPLISIPAGNAEELVAYCARVSNPDNQGNMATSQKLIDYCIRNKHWSVFEMVNAVVEVNAPRDITRQLLRHRSFSFQEFSQRYAEVCDFTVRDFRAQDFKNRQNSIDSLDGLTKMYYKEKVKYLIEQIGTWYKEAIEDKVAKECARVFLPEGLTMSRLYVNGTLRSWLHYLDVRDDPGVTQHEHVMLAQKIREALEPAFPSILGKKDA